MKTEFIIVVVLAGLGAVGFCLIVAAFVLVARQGGWKIAVQQPIAEGRWPPARRLMLAGASLGLLFAVGVTILRLIPGGIPWIEPPANERPNNDRSATDSPNVAVSPLLETENRPPSGDVNSVDEQPVPDFDPRLILTWPGTPEESRRRIDAGTDRQTTIYGASVTQFNPITSFSATVYEITEKDLQGGDPKEWLPHHLGGGNVVEQTRQQIEHGPNKYLGFEVTARDENLFIRRVNVLVGRRIYIVEVNSLRQERLNADDVAQFFESFEIKE